MNTARTLMLSIILSGLSLPQMAQADSSRKSAEQAIAEWNRALKHGDVSDIMAFYTDDAMLLQPSGSVARKSSEIRSFWKSLIKKGHDKYAVDVVKVSDSGANTVIAQTKWVSTAVLDGAAKDVMNYYYDSSVSTVLKRQADGSWKANIQKWN